MVDIKNKKLNLRVKAKFDREQFRNALNGREENRLAFETPMGKEFVVIMTGNKLLQDASASDYHLFDVIGYTYDPQSVLGIPELVNHRIYLKIIGLDLNTGEAKNIEITSVF